ncbi:sensor for ctr capsule biosynthesis, probable histidine kinase acting on RcsB [hydrothermal vent metagenome]|uniref:Sensor for ctr capsule biosynthesis, probable histidine kinase acting on RcsB n=1 Tax=hydrothermal vent metagenome TaxID=652676 RepID=A0A3B0USY5_9ZZZZ
MGKKILIAEDSSVILNLTKKILMQQNFEIVTVKNGQAVLGKLQSESFDLILMDINMPILDGMETTRKVRDMKDSNIANLPIFAITGNAGNYSIDEFKAVGINEYLQKPLDFDRLVTLVNKYTS